MHLPMLESPPLPPLYARWVDAVLQAPIRREREATCDDCAMVLPPGAPTGGVAFNPATKCCTYVPELPNFVVGNILRDRDAALDAGRASVERRIAARAGVSPLGLMQDERFKLIFHHTIAGFGRSASLLCPHYLSDGGGRCSIWAHREATCATWFCKHERGPVAKTFWNRLNLFLKAVEMALARHCVVSLDLGARALSMLFPIQSPRDASPGLDAAQVDGAVDVEGYDSLWGKWAGREVEFFERSAAIVEALSAEQVLTLAGAEGALRASLLKATHARMTDDSLPERLRVGSFMLLGTHAEMCRVQSYSFLDPLDLPRVMFEALTSFDGRPWREALGDAQARAGDDFGEDSVRKLYDFGILVDG